VANKVVDGKQCTVVWHVDDLKISHMDPKVVTTILNLLGGKYGQKALTITRGTIHDYLSTTLDQSEEVLVKIGMRDYGKKILSEMPQDMDGIATSPAGSYLFQIKEGIEDLDDQAQSEFFHATVAQLLFLCKRGRPNIQMAMAFLCTRVQQPTKHDSNKLARTIKYI
jgi:hypothetical protein